MGGSRFQSVLLMASAMVCLLPCAYAGDLKIKLPKRSSATPVQQLNRQGVQQLKRHHLEKARELFLKAYLLDPDDPFTLNNLGYISELEGDLDPALRYYSSAASSQSSDAILVTPNPKWRGRSISEVAEENARAVNKEIAKGEDLDAQIARLNLRGVAAINHNDAEAALKFFQEAYKLDPRNAFCINNMGYVAEMEGDRETAQSYSQEARKDGDADRKMTYATRRTAEGLRLQEVAQDNQVDVSARMAAIEATRRRGGAPMPQLKHRDNTPVLEPEVKQAPPLENVTPPAFPTSELPNRPEQPPPAAKPPQQPGDVIPPLPESQQPAAGQNPSQQPSPAAQPSQQPPHAKTPSGPPAQPPQQPQSQSTPDVIPPLPESQQPPAAKTPPQQPPPPPERR